MPAANKDSLIRLLTMMQMIPLYPRWITAKSLHQGLADQGYDVTKRTIERDLNRFSTILGLVSVDSPEGNKWSYSRDTQVSFLPALSNAEALSLKMVQQHLNHHLPPFLFTNMQAMFSKAERVLQDSHNLSHWVFKVAVVPPGIPIRPHQDDPNVIATLYRGLLENRKVKIRYRNQKQDYSVSLLGLIVRDNKLVFVCYYEGFKDTRMILAHRVRSAELEDEKHSEAFDLQQYAQSGQPGSAITNEDITLEMEVRGYVKLLLSESTIGKHQSMQTKDECWSSVSVMLPYTRELEHWLMSHINDIKIIGPQSLKQ
ncbi:hypothetical protein GCM10009092_02080 [Bowmanella denitrificans]|uniref:WYL domain-containing protein n=1 Tax=Bowmanella denitrificans TaxID=366582 RepID=A0ABP3GB74_9ALTE